MTDNIVSALIGAGVASLGWVVCFCLQEYSTRRARRERFLRRQIDELYAPLVGLIERKRHLQDAQNKRLSGLTLGQDDFWKIFHYLQTNFTIKTLRMIGDLLRTKRYLAAGWPPSFDQFLEHESKSVAMYMLFRDTNQEGGDAAPPWPDAFQGDAARALEMLRHRLPGMTGH